MAKNLVQCLSHVQGVKFDVTAPASGVDAGDVVRVGSYIVGVALNDQEGATCIVNISPNIWRVPCSNGGTAQVIGARMYYDDADAELNESATGNTFAGILMEPLVANADGVMTAVLFNSQAYAVT